MRLGATIVTFARLAGTSGTTNCLQVIDEIQATKSAISVSGLRFSFTMRFPAGSLLHALPLPGDARSTCAAPAAARAVEGITEVAAKTSATATPVRTLFL